MKRWFSLALVALFLVPVLTIPAAAAEVYVFEYMELPVVFSDGFDFLSNSTALVYEGVVPAGVYDGVLIQNGVPFTFLESVELEFDLYDPDGDFWYCTESICLVSGSIHSEVSFIFVHQSACTIVANMDGPVPEGVELTLTRIGDLPSQGGFTSMFEDFSAFTGSCVNFVSKVVETITGSPLLLLTCGFLFLGGCIGITGRLLDRR